METERKMKAITKVNLKVSFSKPRLVNDVPPEAKPESKSNLHAIANFAKPR